MRKLHAYQQLCGSVRGTVFALCWFVSVRVQSSPLANVVPLQLSCESFDDLEDGTVLTGVLDSAMGRGSGGGDLADVKRRLANFFGIELPADEIVFLAKLVLGCAVQSDNKEDFIETITQLDEGMQADLMGVIQEVREIAPATLPASSPF